MQQPGYISGETLHAVDDPNHYLVISSWDSEAHWQAWFENPDAAEAAKGTRRLHGITHPDPGLHLLNSLASCPVFPIFKKIWEYKNSSFMGFFFWGKSYNFATSYSGASTRHAKIRRKISWLARR